VAEYYVNRQEQANGDHEVHRADCTYVPSEMNRIYLGAFANCFSAVKEAKKFYAAADGCKFCSSECHKI